MVKVSVIIPVYNMEKYLNECLDSIVNQTLKDLEIICVNDGSTDNSSKILKEYANNDSRINIINQENKGLASARNTGLEHVNGDYIYFIDSDDYIEITALEKLYNLSQEKNLDLIIFKLANFDDKTKKTNYHYSDMPFLLDIDREVFTYHDFEEYLFKVDVTVYTKFFKKELIINDRFPDGLIFEDNAFYYDYIFDAKRIFFLDTCLHYRRIRDDSIISLVDKNHTDIIEIYKVIYKKFKDRKIYDKYREKLFMRKIDSIYYRFTTINPKYKQYYFDLMKTDFLNQKYEYDNEFDLNKIHKRTKRIFNAVLKSNEYSEIKSNLKNKKPEKSRFKKFLNKIKGNE